MKTNPGRRWWVPTLAISIALAMDGCLAENDRDNVDSGTTTSSGGIGGGGGTTETLYYWDTDITTILSNNCGGSCHGSGTTKFVDATADYSTTVDNQLNETGNMKYVTPSDTANSYLYLALTDAGDEVSDDLSSNSNPTDIGIITDWINQGAPETP